MAIGMNAPAQVVLLEESVSRATDRANCWRGWAVNQFARGERILADSLKARDCNAKIPDVLKQRVEQLRPQVDTAAQTALDEFLRLTVHRNALAHGDGMITVDRRGRWVLRLTLHHKSVVTEVFHFEPEANELREELRAAISRLKGTLQLNSRSPDRGDTPSA